MQEVSPGIPTFQHSDLKGLQFPQLRDTFNRRVDNDQDHWYKIKSQIEKDARSLDNGIESKLKIFQAVFLELSDKSCMQKIDTHFILEKISYYRITFKKLENLLNYRIILQKCHMEPAANHQVDSDTIQLCVEILLIKFSKIHILLFPSFKIIKLK